MMKLQSQTTRQIIFTGAISGIKALVIYGIVECWFSSILPWVLYPAGNYKQLHWGFTVLLFGLYPALGMILGCLCALFLFPAAGKLIFFKKVPPKIFFSVCSLLMIILAYVINIIYNYNEFLSLSNVPEFFISILLVLVLAASTRSSIWLNRLSFLANPFAVSVVLLGLPWIRTEFFGYSSEVLKAAASLAYLVIILMILFVGKKILETFPNNQSAAIFPVSSAKPFLFIAPVVLLSLGTSYFLKQTPLVVHESSKVSTPVDDFTNIIIVVLDTVRADHLSLYGYEKSTSPNLKRFSEMATLYTQAISPSDHTLSTHASLFTGMYAKKHKAHLDPPSAGVGRPLDDSFQTLAEILVEKGYHTMAVVANHGYVSPDFGISQGFQYYDYRRPVPFLGMTKFFYLRLGIRNLLIHFTSPFYYEMAYRRAEDINIEVFNLLGKIPENGRPFFLFINYMDAHWPYIPPAPFDKRYLGKDVTFTSINYRTMKKEVLSLKRNVTEKERAHLVSQYDGSISYIDLNVGKLIAEINRLGLYENSLIIITSDHGECFGERNLIEHPVSVYQDQVHVPLIVKYPYTRQKAVEQDVVSLVDLMPTIMDVAGFEIPDGVEGESLLTQSSGKTRPVISESRPYDWQLNMHPRFQREERAIFFKQLKFINSTSGKRELYDLSEDPGEKVNLYKENHPVAIELGTELSRWLKQESEVASEQINLETDTVDRLRSLGYVQ